MNSLVASLFLAMALHISVFSMADFLALREIVAKESSALKPVAEMADNITRFITSTEFVRSNSTIRPVVTVIMQTPYTGPYAMGPISSKSIEIALDRLRSLNNWLPDYDIAVELLDDACDDALALNELMTRFELTDNSGLNRLPLFFITNCAAQERSVEVLRHYNFIGMNILTNNGEFLLQRRRYGSYFALGERQDIAYKAVALFARQMGWRQIAVLSEIYTYYNKIEQYFFPILDELNITLGWVGKVTYASDNPEEMSGAMEELASHGQRIIVVNADAAPAIACWLHRNKMFGLSYAFFFLNWVYLPPEANPIPDYISSWCTHSMIAQVYEGAFFFGDSSLLDVYGEGVVDSTGLTGGQFVAKLKARIINPEVSISWEYARSQLYDTTVFLGFLLNQTETILRQRNETLLDYTISSENFLSRPLDVIKVYEDAMYSIRFHGFKGVYEFERSTTVNSKGYTPTTIFQVQNAEEAPDVQIVVAYQTSNRTSPLTIRYKSLEWRTKDGLPPRDRVLILMTETPLIAFEHVGVLIGIGMLLVVLNGGLLLAAVFGKGRVRAVQFSSAQMMTFVGNLVIASHVLALPTSEAMTPRISNHCMAMCILVAAGYSASMFGIFWQLARFRKEASLNLPQGPLTVHFTPRHSQIRQGTNSLRAPVPFATQSVTERTHAKPKAVTKKHEVGIQLGVLIISACLIASYCAVDSPVTSRVNGAIYYSVDDPSLAYQTFSYVPTSGSKLEGICLASIFGVLQLALVIRTAFLSYQIYKAAKYYGLEMDKRTMNCPCCVIILFIGAIFLLLTLGTGYLLPIVSWAAMFYVLMTFALTCPSTLMARAPQITTEFVA